MFLNSTCVLITGVYGLNSPIANKLSKVYSVIHQAFALLRLDLGCTENASLRILRKNKKFKFNSEISFDDYQISKVRRPQLEVVLVRTSLLVWTRSGDILFYLK